MSDSDGSPQREDRHHRRSRSRSPIPPDWAGETTVEREERRLAEAVVLVGPPAGQPRAASADTGPSTQELELAEVTAPAAQTARPAAPPREGAPDARGAETAAPASHAAAPTAAPGTPPTQGGSPSAATWRIAEGCRSRRGEQRGVARGCDRGPGEPRHHLGRPRRGPQDATKARDGPRTDHRRLANGRRSRSSGQGGRKVPRPRQPQPHPHQPPQALPPQALPPGADATRPPPGTRALAAGRHAAAAAEAAGRPARDPGRKERRAGRAACQQRERGAGDRRRQGKCPGARTGSGRGHTRQGARVQTRTGHRGQKQRRGTERGQRTARHRAGSRGGARAREGRAGARAGRPGAWGGARDVGRARPQPRAGARAQDGHGRRQCSPGRG